MTTDKGNVPNFESQALRGAADAVAAHDGEPIGPDHLTRADIEHFSACAESFADLCDALAALVPMILAQVGKPASGPVTPPGIIKRR